MGNVKRVRLIAIILPVSVLALALCVQALSSVTTKTAAELSAGLMPFNGAAQERLAFEQFVSRIQSQEGVAASARASGDLARKAYATDPLSPKALALMAMRLDDDDQRESLLTSAAGLNRRDITLQVALLQQYTASSDYRNTTETLDRILRTHPDRSAEFFPLLLQALVDEAATPLFVELLTGSSPWHEDFLFFAVREPEALLPLVQVRQQTEIRNERFDRSLIASLAAQGLIAEAEDLYRLISGAERSPSQANSLGWDATYQPFEWNLADEPGFRAQTTADESELEFALRPGRGGAIASRLLAAPEAPFRVKIENRISPADQMRDVRLQLICVGSRAPFFDQRFSRQGDGFRIDSIPNDCDYFVLAINARAWSGRSALGGTIENIEITR